jgi:tRNA pseudouridine65 synthase
MRIPATDGATVTLNVLYQDDDYVLIEKPPGMLLHRSRIAQDRVFVLQTLRDQLGTRVYPVHRLDRATSGVVAFGLNAKSARRLAEAFAARAVDKRYLAVARGWVDAEGLIDHPVADDEGSGVAQHAVTRYRRLRHIELSYAVDRYPTSRYSLVCIEPLTGRRQQIRKHFKHISHHLIGDTTHGNGRHNRFFRSNYDIHRLLLLAWQLRFRHPDDNREITVTSPLDADWQQILRLFNQSVEGLARCAEY